MRRKNKKSELAPERNKRLTILTNNWLCDLKWQQRTGIEFDETMLVSGGSDTAFFRAAKSVGARVAWCPGARVFETIMPERLSLIYQFKRAAAQSITHFRMKYQTRSTRVVASTLVIAVVRLALGAALFLIPVYGPASPVIAVRSMDWAVGRVSALLGNESELYK